MTARGLLVAFEGGDGSGKSTQARILAERVDGLLTRQAGGTALGQRIRELTLSPEIEHVSDRAEALLYMADRAEHVDEVIEPALAAGRHVVSDRYAFSSFAYQGYGRGLDVEELRRIADWAMRGLWPDVVVLIEVPVDLTAERRDSRSDAADHYEASGAGFQSRIVDGYRRMAAADPQRWRVVDGSGTIEDVARNVWAAVEPVFQRAGYE